MNGYLFTARSITHAQQMAKALDAAGIHTTIRRASAGMLRHGCGYVVAVPERYYAEAIRRLDGTVRPIRVFRVQNGEKQEVAL